MKDCSSITVGDLKYLLDGVDDDKEIRVWAEQKNEDNKSYLSGRRLVSGSEDGNYYCLVAAFYDSK